MIFNHLDALTSLPNRILFNETLNKAIIHAQRFQKILGLLYIEIDQFKSIVEKYGLDQGNEIIKELGQRLVSALRADDTIARLDENEFAVLITDLEHHRMLAAVAEKLLVTADRPMRINNEEVSISICIGISMYPDNGHSLEDLQNGAMNALIIAQNAGRRVYHFATRKMNLQAHEYLETQRSLRNALKKNEFFLNFQPQVDLKKWNITGVEALLRWIHPRLGLINPLNFIPIAEETGLMLEIGEWVLREACLTNKNWQKAGYKPISVSVNLSPKQFYHPDLRHVIETILHETELDPQYLDLEITEMTIIENTREVNQFFDRMRNLGINISIDDFGTGHTSITYLKDFPIQILKIDQSFIKSLPSDANNAAITSAIITLAHQLGVKVIAEGVETLEQLEFLSKNHCQTVQGYFISYPLPAEKIAPLLQKEPG